MPLYTIPEIALYRTFQPLAVIVWYVYLVLIGWASLPLLYKVLPGLSDRVYALSRLFGLLFTAWLAWLLASFRILNWSSSSILIALVILSVISFAAVNSQRGTFVDWLRASRRTILSIEALFAALFLLGLLLRLKQPDLWDPRFGGEKPMDFAYFNAVLKSQTFPPYDPWYAGGTINYYYFGFVIMGAPVKVLGIPPSIAYNLIISTIFALTGTLAFCAAYTLLAPTDDEANGDDQLAPNDEASRVSLWKRLWQTRSLTPIIAGWTALLLILILGNLDEIRTYVWGLAELGTGIAGPVNSYFPPVHDILIGLPLALKGQSVPVGNYEWFWNATRVIPGVDGYYDLTEFPYFTFLYGDLHPHMMALPIALAAIMWCIAQIRVACQADQTGYYEWKSIPALAIGGLIIGALWATNTWDWPTYVALAACVVIVTQLNHHKNQTILPALAIGGTIAVVLTLAVILIFSPGVTPPSPLNTKLIGVALAVGLISLFIGFRNAQEFFRKHGINRAASNPASVSELDAATFKPVHIGLSLVDAVFSGLTLAGLSILFFLPFILNNDSRYSSAGIWTLTRTPVWAYLDILGLFLFIIVSWLVRETWHWAQSVEISFESLKSWILPLVTTFIVLAVGIALLSQEYPIALISIPLILWALLLFLRPSQSLDRRFVLMIFIQAVALTLIMDMFVLIGDLGRVNTVFKFYMQIWVFMGIAAGAAFGWLIPALLKAKWWIRVPWLGTLLVLVLLAGAFPIVATPAKIRERWNHDVPLTLDGMTFMPYIDSYGEHGASFPLKPDYEMLRWLQSSISGTPVVLEGISEREYLWGSRVAVYTGFPDVIGWRWQQIMHGLEAGTVDQRVVDVNEAYTTTDIARKMEIINRYQVELIIVGNLERTYYLPEGLQKFDDMAESGLLEVIYEQEGTKIYRVVE